MAASRPTRLAAAAVAVLAMRPRLETNNTAPMATEPVSMAAPTSSMFSASQVSALSAVETAPEMAAPRPLWLTRSNRLSQASPRLPMAPSSVLVRSNMAPAKLTSPIWRR